MENNFDERNTNYNNKNAEEGNNCNSENNQQSSNFNGANGGSANSNGNQGNNGASNNGNQPVDNRTFGEKTEDAIDEVMGGVQDFFYGPGDDYANDIPATMEMPNDRRKVNKVQTRRNFNKKLFGKNGKWIFLGLFALMLLIGFIVSKIG